MLETYAQFSACWAGIGVLIVGFTLKNKISDLSESQFYSQGSTMKREIEAKRTTRY